MEKREIWRRVELEGFADCYQVSNLGRVRGRKGLLRQIVISKYFAVALYRKSDRNTRLVYVAKLVAAAFKKNRPANSQIEHKDQNSLNNCASNLKYVTQSENIRRSYKLNPSRIRTNGRKLSEKACDKIMALWERGFTQVRIARACGVSNAAVSRIVNSGDRQYGKREVIVDWKVLRQK